MMVHSDFLAFEQCTQLETYTFCLLECLATRFELTLSCNIKFHFSETRFPKVSTHLSFAPMINTAHIQKRKRVTAQLSSGKIDVPNTLLYLCSYYAHTHTSLGRIALPSCTARNMRANRLQSLRCQPDYHYNRFQIIT